MKFFVLYQFQQGLVLKKTQISNMDTVKSGDNVLLLWGGEPNPEKLQICAETVKKHAGENGKVQVDNEGRLSMAAYGTGNFDVVLCGYCGPMANTQQLMNEIARILKPTGGLCIREPLDTNGSHKLADECITTIKLAGLVDVTQSAITGDDKLFEIKAKKPNYEVGASRQLSFANSIPASTKPAAEKNGTAGVWALSANDMMDDDLIDDDDLLDEDDLKKPDPESLKSDCGGEKKRKACKNCTCGLAEELAEDKPVKQKTVTSSCGSCYLGDAFRCASCPYLGMPAFKPGEKIELSNRQLQADK